MKHFFFIILSLTVIFSVYSCRERETEEFIQERVDSFAVHYFNWHYPQCVKYVTPESKKYIEMLASNVTENNVDMLRSMSEDAQVEINDIILTDDSNAKVFVTVHNYLAADTIGRDIKFHEEGTAELKLVRKADFWYVDMSDGCIRTAFRQQNESPDPDQNQDEQ